MWYETCKTEHTACESTKQRILPTRLLHWTGEILRLQYGSQIPSKVRYATLSHCWGENPNVLKLKQDNIKKFQLPIPVHRLCPTFQDALYILRYIGLENLWIDSLCIIQDSVTDWERESSLLSAVYSFSELTIAATHASDRSQGYFTSRNLEYPAEHYSSKFIDYVRLFRWA
jgi:hypothetical protein